MVLNINEIIDDQFTLKSGYLYRDGFVFTYGQEEPIVFDRIVIRYPKRARADESQMGYSGNSLEEHVAYINKNKIEKALIICDNLDFITECPTLKDIQIRPSYEAKGKFDYSRLYEMPNLKSLVCDTQYGEYRQHKTLLDYSQMQGLEEIILTGMGHENFEALTTLKNLWISQNKKIRDCKNISSSMGLEKLTIDGCSIQSIQGIDKYRNLKSLTLWHNYSLTDISGLSNMSDELTELTIGACSKIKDFSALSELRNIQYLSLEGNNKIPNLQFLEKMNKLKVFIFTINVEDGDLSNCMSIPYVSCKNRKHYNYKDENLPKN